MTDKITSADMEHEVARYFNWRQNLIVPNVSWGLGLHECDLLICSKSGYCTEVEIKISRADLIKDKEKSHGHKSNKIKYLYFAIPEALDKPEIIEHIPERAGILVVYWWEYGGHYKVKYTREPVKNACCRALTGEEQYKMASLGAMRVWDLKTGNVSQKNMIKDLRKELTELKAKM